MPVKFQSNTININPISRHRCFTRSCGKTPIHLVNKSCKPGNSGHGYNKALASEILWSNTTGMRQVNDRNLHLKTLPHWGCDKVATIFETTFSNAFSWMGMYKFRLIFAATMMIVYWRIYALKGLHASCSNIVFVSYQLVFQSWVGKPLCKGKFHFWNGLMYILPLWWKQ